MKQYVFTSLILASLLGFTGCGGGGGSETEVVVETTEEVSDARLIKLTGNDQMRYNMTEIKAAAGETIAIQLTNIGKMPAAAMSHNWVLLNRPVTEEEFVAFATTSSANPPTYIAPDSDLVLVHTDMLGPGESDTVEFTVPSTPGEYQFVCTFPGHYALMRGKLIVE